MGDDRITPPDPIRRRVPTLKAGVPRPAKGSAPIPRGESADDPEAVRRIHELEAQNAELVGQLNTAARRQQESVSPAPPPRVESVPPPSGKGDQELGKAVRVLLGRAAAILVPSVISAIGGGWIGSQGSAKPEKVQAVEVRTGFTEGDLDEERKARRALERRLNEAIAAAQCERERADEAFSWLLPAPDRMKSKRPPWRGFDDECPALPKVGKGP